MAGGAQVQGAGGASAGALRSGPGAAARKAPPLRVPAQHFAAALLFLVAGTSGLVLIAPELAAGFHLSPRAAGVTHLFTLGWITTSIMGALYQFLPVALGEGIRSVRVADATFLLYVPGLAAFIAGLVLGVPPVMLAGAGTFGAGVLMFAWNLGATLRKSRQRDVTWWALLWADVFLVVTLLLGLALAGNLRWGFLGAGRYDAVGTHLHVALAGWVLLVMVGVAHRLLPMFLLSHGASDRYARAAVSLLAAGAGGLAVLHHFPLLLSRVVPGVLIAAGAGAFLLQARQFYRHRHRPVLDPGMRLAAAGLGLLAFGVVAGGPVIIGRAAARVDTAYVALLVLGISVFVGAHYFKIVPFLVWFHRYGPLAGQRAVPRVAELYRARRAHVTGALLAIGASGFVVAVAVGNAFAARAAALLLCAGALALAGEMVLLAGKKP